MTCCHQEKRDGGIVCHSPSVMSQGVIPESICDGCGLANKNCNGELPSRGLGDTIAKITKATPTNHSACTHRGELLRSVKCKPCQGILNAEIYSCDIHSECAERVGVRSRGMSGRLIHTCRHCDDYAVESYPATKNPAVKQWAVGITTAPRSKHRTLPECVDSVKAAGWEPIIFAEPGTKTDDIDAEVRENPERRGVWHNWREMCKTLLREFPDADTILTIQDDTIFHPQSKGWAEANLWPTKRPCLFSFYCPMHYSVRCDVVDKNGKVIKSNLPYETAKRYITANRKRGGWRKIDRPKPTGFHKVNTGSLWGACALAFPRDFLERIINHKIARNWKGVAPKRRKGETATARKQRMAEWDAARTTEPWRIQNSDTAIGKLVNILGGEFWYTEPSLADHIADASADGVNHGGRGGRRSARENGGMASGDLRDVFKGMK